MLGVMAWQGFATAGDPGLHAGNYGYPVSVSVLIDKAPKRYPREIDKL